MSAPNELKLISAHDILSDALDLVYAIDLIGRHQGRAWYVR
jgi:hypothetical protein